MNECDGSLVRNRYIAKSRFICVPIRGCHTMSTRLDTNMFKEYCNASLKGNGCTPS